MREGISEAIGLPLERSAGDRRCRMCLAPRWMIAAAWVCVLVAGLSVLVRADDETDLLESVRAYFDAELAGDVTKVWDMLAPSSAFRRAYSYPFFVELFKDNAIRLRAYTIEKVLEISDNEDKVRMPLVERVASVQVHVVLSDKDGKRFGRTSAFTFLRERGRWYKG